MTKSIKRRPITGEAFERQPGEPPSAFTSFTRYRDMGQQRSLVAACNHGKRKNGAPPKQGQGACGACCGWSSVWHWVERAGAWDNHQDSIRRKAMEAEVIKMAQRQAQEAGAIQRASVVAIRALLGKVAAAGGDEAALKDASVHDLLFFLRPSSHAYAEAVKVERLARGLTETEIGVGISEASSQAEALRKALSSPRAAELLDELAQTLSEDDED